MRKKRSLVIGPLDPEGMRVLRAVREALLELGVEVSSFDAIEQGASWATAITDAIRSADFLVVDIGGGNANVFYELGYAHALRKPSILIASLDTSKAIPSDLAGYQLIVYEPQELRNLVVRVRRAAIAFISKADEA